MRYIIRFTSAMLACTLVISSCKTDKDDNDNPNPSARETGLNDTDDESKIPKNINYSANFFNNSNNTLPAKTDLEMYLPPVGNQGSYGTCVAWAVGYNFKTAIEAIKFNLTNAQLSSPTYQISPLDLFISIPDDKKGADNCGGSNFTVALDQILNRGVATMAVAPYSGITGQCQRSLLQADWTTDAAKHKIERYRAIPHDIKAIKQELANNVPVILGAKLADNFMTWNNDAVLSSNTTYNNVGQHSYHALCIVGYDDSKGTRGAFRVVNSWDRTWGDNGFIWVDYDFMKNEFAMKDCFFVATNDQQKPEPGPNPNPNPSPGSGTDLMPWVFTDRNEPISGYPSRRYMEFDIYNLGVTDADPNDRDWSYAYIYYNAYNANDYGIAFMDSVTSLVPRDGQFYMNTTGTGYWNAIVKAGGSSLSYGLSGQTNYVLQRSYLMPNKTGTYYLLVVADLTNAWDEEDRDNNLFYTTSQYPINFANGVGQRIDGKPFTDFKNKLASNEMKSDKAQQYRTAVNESNPNAYAPDEVLGMLKAKAFTGDLQLKIREYRTQKTNAQAHTIAVGPRR